MILPDDTILKMVSRGLVCPLDWLLFCALNAEIVLFGWFRALSEGDRHHGGQEGEPTGAFEDFPPRFLPPHTPPFPYPFCLKQLTFVEGGGDTAL